MANFSHIYLGSLIIGHIESQLSTLTSDDFPRVVRLLFVVYLWKRFLKSIKHKSRAIIVPLAERHPTGVSLVGF